MAQLPLSKMKTTLKLPFRPLSRLLEASRCQRRTLSSSSNHPVKSPPREGSPIPKPDNRMHHHGHHYWPEMLWTHAQALTYPFKAYGRAQSRRPYVVQLTSSLIIYFLGDLSAQYIQRPVELPLSSTNDPFQENSLPISSFADRYAPDRTLRALIIGGIMSIPSYHWFLFLSRNFNVSPSRTRFAFPLSLLNKIIVNQIVFTPLFNSYFFGMQSLLTTLMTSSVSIGTFKKGLRESWIRIKNAVPTSWWNSCKFWPIVTAFSFTFVPPQSRSVFAGVVAIGWQAYLGMLNQRAAKKEAEHALLTKGIRAKV